MEKIAKSFLIALIFALLNISAAYSQWQTDYRLTNSNPEDYLCMSNAHSVAASGDTVHVVFGEFRDQTNSIFYKRSLDGGVTWSPDIIISGAMDNNRDASIAVLNGRVHVSWVSALTGQHEIYYRLSTNGGYEWRAMVSIVNFSSISVQNPSIALSGSYVHITWMSEVAKSESFISYRSSSNGGLNFGTLQQLTVGGLKGQPSVCSTGDKVMIFFHNHDYGNREISMMRSTNSGSTWPGGLTRLTDDPAASQFPSASAAGDTVYITWSDNRTGDYQIYFKKSANGGQTWQTDHKLTSTAGNKNYPSIAAWGTYVHLTWSNNTDHDIYYLRGIYSGNSWQQIVHLTEATSVSEDPSIAASGPAVHILWRDTRDNNGEVYYKRNPTGNMIGITSFSSQIPLSFELYQNYPNPFNPTTKIKFDIPRSGYVTLKIFDVLGREVSVLVNEFIKPGVYETDFDASRLPSGVYFYKLISGDFSETKKMILLK